MPGTTASGSTSQTSHIPDSNTARKGLPDYLQQGIREPVPTPIQEDRQLFPSIPFPDKPEVILDIDPDIEDAAHMLASGIRRYCKELTSVARPAGSSKYVAETSAWYKNAIKYLLSDALPEYQRVKSRLIKEQKTLEDCKASEGSGDESDAATTDPIEFARFEEERQVIENFVLHLEKELAALEMSIAQPIQYASILLYAFDALFEKGDRQAAFEALNHLPLEVLEDLQISLAESTKLLKDKSVDFEKEVLAYRQ